MAELIRAGQTEVTLDADALQPATGLTVSSVSDISASESSDFDFGLDITEDSNFVFDEVDDFASANGTIEHTGTITYTGSIGDVTVGDFSVGFDESRVSDTTSGFFVANNIEEVLPEGQILFDVGIPDGVNVGGNRINIGTADLLVAEEFAETLQTQGLTTDDVTGADAGDAAISGVAEFAETLQTQELTTDDVAGADAEDAAISGVAEFAAVTDGTTNVSLDAATLASEAGLTVSTTEGTVEPTSEEFALGFDITEESSFIFGNEDEFTPLDGVIEHTGTVTLETGAVDITVGDFSVSFDESRVSDTASGFFISNGVESIIPAGAVLLDIATPEAIEATDDGLNIGTADLLVADEFASILQESGLASTDLTGADVGDASIDALLG